MNNVSFSDGLISEFLISYTDSTSVVLYYLIPIPVRQMYVGNGCQCLLLIMKEIIVIQYRWSKIRCLLIIAINDEEICVGYSFIVCTK